MKVNWVLVGGDAVQAWLALYAGSLIRFGYNGWAEIYDTPSIKWFFVLILLLTSYISELYDLGKHRKKRETFINILISASFSLVILSIVFFFNPELTVGRGVLAVTLSLFVLFQFLWHVIFSIVFDHPYLTERIIVLGTGPLAARVDGLVCASSSHFNHLLAGFVTCESEKVPKSVPEEKVIGSADNLLDIVLREKVSKIIVSLSERRGVFPLREVLRCRLNGIEVVDTPTFF